MIVWIIDGQQADFDAIREAAAKLGKTEISVVRLLQVEFKEPMPIDTVPPPAKPWWEAVPLPYTAKARDLKKPLSLYNSKGALVRTITREITWPIIIEARMVPEKLLKVTKVEDLWAIADDLAP